MADANGNTATATVVITINQHQGVSVSGGVMRVGGVSGADRIAVRGSSLRINGRAHPLSGVTEVRIWAREGNDVIHLRGLAVPSFVHGGQGNDQIVGGSADDVIFGDDGNDNIVGDTGHDFLTGGTGKDPIVGSAGHDILASAEVAFWSSLRDLRTVSSTWKESKTVTQQAADEFIDESFSDHHRDMFTGGSGADLFIITKDDKITDFRFQKSNKDGDVVIVDGLIGT